MAVILVHPLPLDTEAVSTVILIRTTSRQITVTTVSSPHPSARLFLILNR